MELASVLNLTDTIPSNWSTISSNITILRDPTSNIVLEFEGFNGTTSVKQADVSSEVGDEVECSGLPYLLIHRWSSSSTLSSTRPQRRKEQSTCSSTLALPALTDPA